MLNKKTIEKNNLNFMGENGQLRFTKSLIENKTLFLQVYPYLDERLFTDEGCKIIVKLFKEFYKEKGMTPSYKDIESLIKKTAVTEEDFGMLSETYSKLRSDLEGQETATEICVNHIKKLKAEEILDKGKTQISKDYSLTKVEDIIDNLRQLEANNTEGSSSVADIEDKIFSRSLGDKVPTGVFQLDVKMGGGLTKGKIGLLIAGTGVGKSTLASIFCCNAAILDYKVLHIFFEDDKEEIGAKYYAHLTEMLTSSFSEKGDKEALKGKIWGSHPNARKALKENVRLLRLPNGCLTAEDLCNEIRKEIAGGFKPDMVFIDYLSCLQTSSDKHLATTNEWQTFERVAKKLESFATETGIAIWEAQQTNRNGLIAKTAADRMANVQGSFRITQPATIILYLDRVGMQPNRANLYLDKCRTGELGEWENISMNNGTCQIDLSQAIPTDAELTAVIDEWGEGD